MKLNTLVTASALALAVAGPAGATIVFSTGNLGGGLSIVTLPQASADDGSDVFLTGTVNPNATQVLFTGAENIDSAAAGQARVVATDGSTLNTLSIALQSGFGADSFVFNLNSDGSTGSVTITALDQFGNTYTSAPLSLGNGQNFFNLTTLGNEAITKVSFTSTPLLDVRQIRFGGVIALAGSVPEPATWALMILGFGGIGMTMRSARRRRAALS